MKNYRKHVDDFFREKLGRYKETPPADVWESLDKRLDGLVPTAPGYSRWFWHAGIVSLIVVMSVSLVKKLTGNSEAGNVTSNEQSIAKAEVPAAVTPAKSTTTATVNAPLTAGDNGNDNGTTQTAPVVSKGGSSTTNNKSGNKNTPAHKPAHANTHMTAGKTPAAHTEHNYNAGVTTKEANEVGYSDNGKGGPLVNMNTPMDANANPIKKEIAKAPTTPKQNTPKKIAEPKMSQFEGGVKAGYEMGFDGNAASKYVVAPFLQYNVSRKFALLTQPAAKYATIQNRNIGTPQSYYDIDPTLTVTPVETTPNTVFVGGTQVVVSNTTKYNYVQHHVNIEKSSTYGGSYMELELPILAKYKFTKELSAYGGVNIVYSKLPGVTEHSSTSQPIDKVIGDSSITTPVGMTATPPSPVANSDASYPGSPYSTYKGPQYASPTGSVRVGYMAGITYEYSKRWLVDALVQQTQAKPDVQGGYNLNNPLSTAYFRLSIGYKLKK